MRKQSHGCEESAAKKACEKKGIEKSGNGWLTKTKSHFDVLDWKKIALELSQWSCLPLKYIVFVSVGLCQFISRQLASQPLQLWWFMSLFYKSQCKLNIWFLLWWWIRQQTANPNPITPVPAYFENKALSFSKGRTVKGIKSGRQGSQSE